MESNKYSDYISSHIESISNYVNSCLEKSKDEIRKEIVDEIKSYLSPIPYHYELVNDPYEFYDHSGMLKEEGLISLDQTLIDFLEEEFSGNKEPSFESGRGWNYNTYEDELSYLTLDLGWNIMRDAIKEYLENEFKVELTEEDMEEIQFSRYGFDEIYDSSITSDFFFATQVIRFLGMENLKLNYFIEE